MKLIKSGGSLALATLIKALLGAMAVKIIVHFIGTIGFGKLGQFMSFMVIIGSIAGGGISNGIISKISINHDNDKEKNEYLTAAFWIGVIFSIFLMLGCLVFSNNLSFLLFKTNRYFYIFLCFGILQFFYVSNVIIGSYLNGVQENVLFSKIQIISSCIGILGLVLFVYFFKFIGAIFGLIWFAIIPGICLLFFYLYKFRETINIGNFYSVKKVKLMELMSYSFMMLVSSLLIPTIQIFVREFIYNKYGWAEVGIWQAASKLSESGLMFLNVIMVNFYLPELGRTTNNFDFKKLFFKAYKLLIPLLSLYIVFVYLFKDLLIKIFYNDNFIQASDLLLTQCIGDAFKVLSLVFGFYVVLKAKIRIYLFFELLLFFLIIILSYFLIPIYGLLGANYAYIITYAIMFSLGLFFLKKTLKT